MPRAPDNIFGAAMIFAHQARGTHQQHTKQKDGDWLPWFFYSPLRYRNCRWQFLHIYDDGFNGRNRLNGGMGRMGMTAVRMPPGCTEGVDWGLERVDS